MQNWNDLIYCLALAEYKTMGKAAKVLRTNATTVSRHINSLSETYQQPIFIKDGQEWRPTKFGLRGTGKCSSPSRGQFARTL